MTTHNDFWSRRATSYDAQLRSDEAAYVSRIKAALSLLGKNHRILDIGCATGEIGLDLATSVAHYEGCDPADGMIAIAREKARERRIANARFYATSAFNQIFERGRYDAVLIFSVLHLVPDAEALLDRAQELLRPNGTLIVETPSLGEQIILKRFMIKAYTIPIKGLCIRSLRYSETKELVRGAGFDILQSRETQREDRMFWISARKTDAHARRSNLDVPSRGKEAFPMLNAM